MIWAGQPAWIECLESLRVLYVRSINKSKSAAMRKDSNSSVLLRFLCVRLAWATGLIFKLLSLFVETFKPFFAFN